LHWTNEDHPLWKWLLAVGAAFTVAPLWSTTHLPFTDLPQHVAAIGTLRHWFDPAWKAREYFTLALGQTQYLLYYLIGAALAFPFGTAENANLVLLSLTAIAFPYSLKFLLRALRADTRLALFAIPLFWSQALLIGFFNYVAAMPLVLWGLGLAVERKRPVLLAIVSAALFYLHLSAFIFFAPAAALASIGCYALRAPPVAGEAGSSLMLPRWAPVREWPRRLLWAAPVVLLSVLWLLNSPVVHPQAVGWRQPMSIAFEEPATALRDLTDALLDIWRGPEDEWSLLALIAAAALLAWPQKREATGDDRLRSLAALWVAFAVVLYFCFPVSIGWLWQLNERYALVFALLLPTLLRPVKGWRGAAPLLLVAAVGFFSSGVALRNFRVFESEVGAFDQVLAQAEPGKRMIGMIFDQNSRVAKFSAFLHYASYYRARSGGIASFSFAELPQSPLRYRPETAPPPHPAGWEWHANAYRNDVDGYYYDYVLVHGLVDPFATPRPGPQFHLLTRHSRWALYGK
jgi:hypothetical protein